MLNCIPLFRGLGSSASATVGGSGGGQLYSRKRAFILRRLLQLACDLEGHPDNVAAALFGGLIVCAADGDEPADLRASSCAAKPPRGGLYSRSALAYRTRPQGGSQGRCLLATRSTTSDMQRLLLTGITQADEGPDPRGHERPPASALPRHHLSPPCGPSWMQPWRRARAAAPFPVPARRFLR